MARMMLLLAVAVLAVGAAAEECPDMHGGTSMEAYGWSCESKADTHMLLKGEAETDLPSASSAWSAAAAKAEKNERCVFCDVPMMEIHMSDTYGDWFPVPEFVHDHAESLNSWPQYTMLTTFLMAKESDTSFTGIDETPWAYGDDSSVDGWDLLDCGFGMDDRSCGFETFTSWGEPDADVGFVDYILNGDYGGYCPCLVAAAQAAKEDPGRSLTISEYFEARKNQPQKCTEAMDAVDFEMPDGYSWDAGKADVFCAGATCDFDAGSDDLASCFVVRESGGDASAPPSSKTSCGDLTAVIHGTFASYGGWDAYVHEGCEYFDESTTISESHSVDANLLDEYEIAYECVEYSSPCDSASEDEIECTPVEHARGSAEYACTSVDDTTVVSGGCEDGYYLQANPGAADTCEECRPMDNCGTTTCSGADDSVCANCEGEHFGLQCQHTDADCNNGTPHHDQETDALTCTCDIGYSGDDCSEAATCDELSVEHPQVISSGCGVDGELGVDSCLLGCDEGFFVVGLAEGLCEPTSDGAAYKGQAAQCHECPLVENCAGTVTCTSADDAKCDSCESGFTGNQCHACPAGSEPSGDGCKRCEKGTFSAGGGGACSPCAAGTYSAIEGARGCSACNPGSFADSTGASECASCPAGKTALDSAATACEECESGKTVGRGGCVGCGDVYKCEGEVTCADDGWAHCAEDGCAKGYHIVNNFQCQKCTTIHGCLEGHTTCTGSTDHKCSQCDTGMYIDHKGHCAKCESVNRCAPGHVTCTIGEPTGPSDSVCNKCRKGWEGDDCNTRVPDMTCLASGHFDGDGTDAPDNESRTAEDFQQCQWMCQKMKGKKINLSEMEPGKKAHPKYKIGGCALFSFNTHTKECRLQAADAGAPCPEDDDGTCREDSLKRALSSEWAEKLRAHGEWLAGPKFCYRATCDTLECPEGYDVDKEHMYRFGSRLKCAAATCDVSKDLHTCCNPAKCGTWTCPKNHVAKPGVEDTQCADHNGVPMCTDEADTDTCCDSNAMCDTLDCGEGWEHMREGIHVSKKPCAGPVCTIDADRLTCCDPLAECARDFECPVNRKAVDGAGVVRFVDYSANPDLADPTYCHARFCEESHDLDTCCVQRAECSSFECPSGYAYNAYARKTQIACVGAVCTEEDDLDRCCFRQVHCGTMQSTADGDVCPNGYSEKDGLSSIMCASHAGRCDPRVDTDTCCNEQETCDEMGAPLFDCAGVNTFFGDDCDIKCLKKKCLAEPTCAWAVGPPGFWNPLGPIGYEDEDNQKVDSGACGYKDCHREWGGCVCPAGIDEWDEPEQMEGAFFKPGTGATAINDWGWQGSEDDFESDCVWHTESVCVDNADFTLRDENGKATSVLSGKKDCTPKRTAPMMSGSDESDKCPDEYILRPHGHEVHCKGPFCTAGDDRDTCCEPRASCDTMLGHPAHHALKTNAADLLCHGTVCTAVDVTLTDGTVVPSDVETCTDSRGSCSDLTCSAGTMNKGSEFLCAAGACDASDEASCCVACEPGKFSANGEDCEDCESGKFSANGYGATGSAECTDCGGGKYSDPGMDHCLDCAPIFGCYSKGGMAYDESTGRRRLFMSAVAVASEITCNGEATSTCDKCVDGYFLTNGRTECHKCNKVPNCKGTHHCTSANDHTCGEGECMPGFFGPACHPCPNKGHELCKPEGLTCDSSGQNAKCTACVDGSYIDDLGMCSMCVQEPNCITSHCEGPFDHTCALCAHGYFPSGKGCGKLYWDGYRGMWGVDVGNADGMEIIRRVTAKLM